MEKIITEIMFSFIIIIFGFALAWIPMLAWNNGIHSVFPNVFPHITYFQAFWIQLLFMSVFSRPQFHNEN